MSNHSSWCVTRLYVQESVKNKVKHDIYLLNVDSQEQKAVDALLHAARVTLTQHFIASAIRAAHSKKDNIESAKTMCNNQIKGWPVVRIKVTDINEKVWFHVQQITAGQQPHD